MSESERIPATQGPDREITRIETSDRILSRCLWWVRDSGTADTVQAAMTREVGRKRQMTWETFFTLLAITAWHGRGNLLLMDVWRVAEGLEPHQRDRLGLSADVTYSAIESALADLARDAVDHYDPFTGEAFGLSRFDRRFEDVLNTLVTGSIPGCIAPTRDVALDSTDLEAWARRQSWSKDGKPDVEKDAHTPEDFEVKPRKTPRMLTRTVTDPGTGERTKVKVINPFPKTGPDGRMRHTKDPDATEGYVTGKNHRRSGIFVGYDVHTLTDVTDLGDPLGRSPLIRAFYVAPAGSSKSEAGLAVLDSARDNGQEIGKVLNDNGYSYCTYDTWALPLWHRGIEQVFALHPQDRGMSGASPLPKTFWLDGTLFIDSLPERLRDLPAFDLNMATEEQEALMALYDERALYAFLPMGSRDADRGTQRYRGPAAGKRMICANAPASQRLDPATHEETTCVEGEECSCSRTLTLGPTLQDGMKLRQHHPYGTTRWKADFGRRNNVESGNAVIKHHHASLRRGSVRVFGRVKTMILLAFILGAANLRLVLSRYGVDPAEGLPEGQVSPRPSRNKPKKPPLHVRAFKGRRARAARYADNPPIRPGSFTRATSTSDPPDRPPGRQERTGSGPPGHRPGPTEHTPATTEIAWQSLSGSAEDTDQE